MRLITRSIIPALFVVAGCLTLTHLLPAQSAKPTVAHYAGAREDAPIPRPGMTLQRRRVALVVTDPQNDFLSPKGVAWGVVGQSVRENRTVENIESLLKAAKASEVPVFVSPHYYYVHDHQWKFEGALEKLSVLSVRLRRAALLRISFRPIAAELRFGRFSTVAQSPIC
jgi:hypothetical protein